MANLQICWAALRKPRLFAGAAVIGLSLYLCLSIFLRKDENVYIMKIDKMLAAELDMTLGPSKSGVTEEIKPANTIFGRKVEFDESEIYKQQPGCKKCASVDFLVFTIFSQLDYKKRLELRKEYRGSFEESTSMLIFVNGQPLNPDIRNEIKEHGDIISIPGESATNESQQDMFVLHWIKECCGPLEMVAKIDGNKKGILEKVLNMGDRVIQGKLNLHNKIFCEKVNEETKTVITKESYDQDVLQRHCTTNKGIYFSRQVVEKFISAEDSHKNNIKKNS